MNKEIILTISLMLLVGLAIFVSANSMVKNSKGVYEAEVYLSEGWNLISGTIPEDGILPDSDVKLSNIKAVWYYSPLQKKYLQVHPNTNFNWDAIQQDDDDFVLTNAMFVYSDKAGLFKYSTLEDYPSDGRQLYSGWNLVSMTPDMIEDSENPDLTFEEIKGNCEVEKAYYFFDGDWVLFDMPEMDSTLLGKGMAIKVSQNCKLEKTGSSTTPPSLP